MTICSNDGICMKYDGNELLICEHFGALSETAISEKIIVYCQQLDIIFDERNTVNENE